METYKYRAFISYSHKDKAFAKWLHKRIENYKIPKSLREKYPHLPKDLKRSIFRDEEELPTSSVLGDNLKYALDNSKKLIVICSPDAVASKWVNEEIRYFKEVHGEFSVLAILKRGEPKASTSSVYDANLEAFPKSLLYKLDKSGQLSEEETEPLAGDARSYWGREMALMKMIAGVLEVDFADLWVREKKEALKRRIIKGVVALCLIGALGFGYYYATENKEIKGYGVEYLHIVDEVSQKRALLMTNISDDEKNVINQEIKELERKLSDIKEASNAISKIDGKFAEEALRILKTKGAKEALTFIDSKESIDNEEKLLNQVANKHRVRANVLIANQKYKEAEESYEKAIALVFSYENVLEYANFLKKQNQLQKSAKLYEKLLEHSLTKDKKATTLNNLANLYSADNRLKEAEKAYNKALKFMRTLAKINPNAYNPFVAMTLNNLGILYKADNRFKEAEKAYNEALELRRALAKVNPNAYNYYVAMTLNNLAILYSDDNRLKEAEKAYYEALKLYRALAKINPNAYNPDVAMTLNNLANLYSDDNRLKEAEKAYSEALKLYRALAKINPNAYNFYVATTLNNLGLLYKADNRFKEAEKAYSEALKLYRALAKINPNAYNFYVATTLNNLASLYKADNRLKEAEKAYSEALELYRALAKINLNAYNPDVATTLNNLGALYYADNLFKEAEKAYSEALELYRALAKINPNAYNFYFATTLNNLGLLFEKSNRIEEAEKAYIEAFKIYPKNGRYYLNLGLSYVKKEEFSKAMDVFKTLIDLNPQDYLVGFVNLFELQIINNQEVNESLALAYKKKFQNNRNEFEIYEALKVIDDITKGKKSHIEVWSKKYADTPLYWNLTRLEKWVEGMQDKALQKKLKDVLDVFRKHNEALASQQKKEIN